MRLYHGTTIENIPNILRRGLYTMKEFPPDYYEPGEKVEAPQISLTDDLEEAVSWGDGTVVVVDVPESWVHKKFTEPVPKYGMREYVLTHRVPAAMIKEVIPSVNTG